MPHLIFVPGHLPRAAFLTFPRHAALAHLRINLARAHRRRRRRTGRLAGTRAVSRRARSNRYMTARWRRTTMHWRSRKRNAGKRPSERRPPSLTRGDWQRPAITGAGQAPPNPQPPSPPAAPPTCTRAISAARHSGHRQRPPGCSRSAGMPGIDWHQQANGCAYIPQSKALPQRGQRALFARA